MQCEPALSIAKLIADSVSMGKRLLADTSSQKWPFNASVVNLKCESVHVRPVLQIIENTAKPRTREAKRLHKLAAIVEATKKNTFRLSKPHAAFQKTNLSPEVNPASKQTLCDLDP